MSVNVPATHQVVLLESGEPSHTLFSGSYAQCLNRLMDLSGEYDWRELDIIHIASGKFASWSL